MATTALRGIAEAAREEAFDSSWWFEPFGLDPPTVAKAILPKSFSGAVLAGGCAAGKRVVPFPLPPGEPEGLLFTLPAGRSGLAALVTPDGKGGKSLTAAWPFTADGVEHEVKIHRLYLSPDRLQAMVEGTIDELRLIWHDVMFAVDRAFYAHGSVHKVVLAGFAHRFSIGGKPIRLMPDAPSYAALRDAAPESVGPDGAIMIQTKGLAAILPVEDPSPDDASPTMFSIWGPVVSVTKYEGPFFGREVWDIRVTVKRIGANRDKPVDLSILVTDVILLGRAVPKVGDDVSALIRLQGRIATPNVQRRGWW